MKGVLLRKALLRLLIPSITVLGTVLLSFSSQAQPGRIESGQITSDALRNNLFGDKSTRPYKVYLPPSYDTSTNRYPVVYVLHGYTQDENALVGTLQSSLDSMIRQRAIGEFIAVFVNGANKLSGSFYLSSPAIGDYETYIAKDLVSLIDGRYRTLSSRESRGLTGFSMGGWGAMHLAFKFSEVFSVAVAESGLYDARGKLMDGLEKQFAALHPTNLAQFAGVPFPANSVAALFAGLSPNLLRPELFADYPYERVNGQVVLINSVHDLALLGDVQHGDLQRYLAQPFRLDGIKLVHGTADSIVPVGEARQFTNALTVAGISFEYQEHPGDHEYRPALALPFLSARLKGAALFLSPPQLVIKNLGAELQLSFATQTNVAYWIESVGPFLQSSNNWFEKAALTGTGQTTILHFPVATKGEFFRIRAANSAN